MSGYTRRGNRSAAGKSDGRMKHADVGSRTEWKPKAKVATDGSLGSVSSCQKDNSSLTSQCVSEKMTNFIPKPALDVNLQQESLSPPVQDLASGMENLKLRPPDNFLKESLTFPSQSDSSLIHPITAKGQQGSKVQTGRGSDMYPPIHVKHDRRRSSDGMNWESGEGATMDMKDSVATVETILMYTFKDKSLLEEALTHSSYTDSSSYQRLEFVGDAALGLTISNFFYLTYPDLDSGHLTRLRAANISTEKLARVAVQHGLHKYVRHKATTLNDKVREFVTAVEGEDEMVVHGGRMKAPKVLADIVESVAAAVYVDCGFDLQSLWMIIRVLLEPMIMLDVLEKQPQPITTLFEVCQKDGKKVDIEHLRNGDRNIASIYVDGRFVASGSSETKENAKLHAAEAALSKLTRSKSGNAMSSQTYGAFNEATEIEGAKQKAHELCNLQEEKVAKANLQVATDGSLGSVSSCQKDNSSLTSQCVSEKMTNFIPKPALDVNLQQESLSPPVQDLASGMENLKLRPPDNGLKESLTFPSQSDPSLIHPITAKNQQGSKVQSGRGSDMYVTPIKPSPLACFPTEDRIPEKGKQIGDMFLEKADSSGRLENTDRASAITRFDICPKGVNSGIKLNVPLHVMNKEKRNQRKWSVERIKVLRPGMVLMKGYISCDDQISIVKTCRELGISDGGFYQPGYRDGSKLHLKMMCLGKNWDPESSLYSDRRPIDNSKPAGIPVKFLDMVKRAIQESDAHIQKTIAKADAGKIIPPMSPDICIVNFYTKGGKLGLHQDKDESTESLNRGLPVVSFSIGDSAEFLYGDVRDIDKAEKVVLESGDVLIFGGKSRHIFHGVSSILPDTAPRSLLDATDMCPGRLNLTFRQF